MHGGRGAIENNGDLGREQFKGCSLLHGISSNKQKRGTARSLLENWVKRQPRRAFLGSQSSLGVRKAVCIS